MRENEVHDGEEEDKLITAAQQGLMCTRSWYKKDWERKLIWRDIWRSFVSLKLMLQM